MKKNNVQKKFLFYLLAWSQGKSELPLLTAVIGFGVILAGGMLTAYHPNYTPAAVTTTGAICCDSGNGSACHPVVDATNPALVYNGVQYGLLKTGVTMVNPCHIEQTTQMYQGKPIIISVADSLQGECGGGKQDQLDGGNCVPIPNDEIVYVCTANCYSTPASYRQKLDNICNESTPNFVSFGDDKTVFNAYFRMSDYPSPGVPDVIKNCGPYVSGTPLNQSTQTQPSIVFHPYDSHESLQLHTLGFDQASSSAESISSFEPYCKPAVYLYPQQKEQVHVQVEAKRPITYSTPKYPATGWTVTADTNGNISDSHANFDYLYYESSIPDNLIPHEEKGYVIPFDELSSFFATTLPKLGLNEKEQKQFSEYWLNALPKSPYYKITMVPQNFLNQQVPLLISPKPDTVLRITLQFQPLDKKVSLNPPSLTPPSRSGFTVVEWGGMFKKDKNHPFTCLM